MATSDKRNTQIDMLKLGGAMSSPKPPEPVRLPGFSSHGGRGTYNVLRKRRAQSEDNSMTEAQVFMSKRRAKLPDTLRPRTRRESPWNEYEYQYKIEMCDWVEVARRKIAPYGLVHVRAFAQAAAEETLLRYHNIQHQNVVAVLDVFTTGSSLYVVLEHMPVSLNWIVRCAAYPTERQLAALLGQMLHGLAYLAKNGLEYKGFSCKNVLLNLNGDVKIAGQENCFTRPEGEDESCTLGAIKHITMELMQNHVLQGGGTGIEDVQRWRPDSDAMGFLSATTSAERVTDLLKHPLISVSWEKEQLIALISLAQVCVRPTWKYDSSRR